MILAFVIDEAEGDSVSQIKEDDSDNRDPSEPTRKDPDLDLGILSKLLLNLRLLEGNKVELSSSFIITGSLPTDDLPDGGCLGIHLMSLTTSELTDERLDNDLDIGPEQDSRFLIHEESSSS